jgi:hypothetical protein
LIERRFHEPRADSLTVAVTLAVIRNEAEIALNVRGEFLNRFEQPSRGLLLVLECCALQILSVMKPQVRVNSMGLPLRAPPSRWRAGNGAKPGDSLRSELAGAGRSKVVSDRFIRSPYRILPAAFDVLVEHW